MGKYTCGREWNQGGLADEVAEIQKWNVELTMPYWSRQTRALPLGSCPRQGDGCAASKHIIKVISENKNCYRDHFPSYLSAPAMGPPHLRAFALAVSSA